MPETDLPTQPGDVTLLNLAGSYARSMRTLRRSESGASALSVLVYGTALTRCIDADRWPTALAALTEGVTLDSVASTMGLDLDDIRVGLIRWAVDQRRGDLMGEARYGEVLQAIRADAR